MESSHLAAGTTFSRYAIVRVIGEGGMGAVYEATHLQLKRRVALKLLLPGGVRNAEARARFFREGELAARLDHPHIVSVLDLGIEGDVPFLVMECLDGEDLSTLLTREGPLPVHTLVEILLPVCAAVAHAHADGIVHRDLKPANIFLSRTRSGEVVPKLLDFGVSKSIDISGAHALTASAGFIGTPNYMSPEQIRKSRDVDALSDQYALGVILYECATGRLPFESDSLFDLMWRIQAGQFVPPTQAMPGLDPTLEQIILRAMACNALDRHASVSALGAALLPLASPSMAMRWAGTFDPVGASAFAKTEHQQQRPIPPTRVSDPPAGTISPHVVAVSRPRRGATFARAVAIVALLAFAMIGGWALAFPGDASVEHEAPLPITRVSVPPAPSPVVAAPSVPPPTAAPPAAPPVTQTPLPTPARPVAVAALPPRAPRPAASSHRRPRPVPQVLQAPASPLLAPAAATPSAPFQAPQPQPLMRGPNGTIFPD